MTPREKRLASTVPETVRRFVILYLEREYRDRFFDEPRPCPRCRYKHYHRADKQRRLFCILIKDEGMEPIHVYLKRYRCKKCNHIYSSRGPFYPNVMYGSPIVDIALFLAAANPFNRVESILMSWGIQVDRDTIKRWVKLFHKRAAKIAGIEIFKTPLGLNIFKLLFGEDDIEGIKKKHGVKKVCIAGDETYPSIKGALKKPREENERRKMEGESPLPHPEAFTLALTYSPELDCFGSIVISRSTFNRLLSKVLMAPTRGADMRCLDGNPSYDHVEHEHCIVHQVRKERKKDPVWKRTKREKTSPEEMYEYAHSYYEKRKVAEVERLKLEYPSLLDEEGFHGVLSTNSMEGGNWRIKYELRTSYKDIERIYGRTLLVAIRDSTYTFRKGRPIDSFASINSSFTYSDVMQFTEQDEIVTRRDDEPFYIGVDNVEREILTSREAVLV